MKGQIKNMNDLVISACAASNVGKRRLNNEDNFYINGQIVNSLKDAHASISDTSCFIGAVCDGMGGEAAGEVASQIAVKTVEDFEKHLIYENCSDSIIEKTINAANKSICDEITKCKKRMGTTFTLIGFNNNTVTLSNIGDSRIYRYSDGVLDQLSHDHTEAQTMVDAGIVTKEQSMKLKEKHRLTQHLGIFPYEMIIEPYTVRLDAKNNDRYLLCSDGLTDMLTEPEIKALLDKGETLENTVDLLISSALEKGGKDNVTVLLCEISKNQNTNVEMMNSKDEIIAAFGIDEISNDKPIEIDNDIQVVSNCKKQINSKKIICIISIICVLIMVFIIAFIFGYKFPNKKVDANSNETTVSEKIESKTVLIIFENMF